jgi:hypothetical protein
MAIDDDYAEGRTPSPELFSRLEAELTAILEAD